MKRLFTIAVLILMMCFPFKINAKTQALNLEDSLKGENIEILFENYEETDDQVTVYLFRGEGCTHCRDFLMFLNEFAKDNGQLFKLRSFEVYNNADNATLKKKVADYFGDKAGGVPYIVIGNKTIYGFAKSDGSEIESIIKAEYEKKDRFDIFDNMEDPTSEVITTGETNERKGNSMRVVLAIVILVVIILLSLLLMFSNFIFKSKSNDKKDEESK